MLPTLFPPSKSQPLETVKITVASGGRESAGSGAVATTVTCEVAAFVQAVLAEGLL
jgi:hypothetical protein